MVAICIVCNGSGRIWSEPSCAVEGNKMRAKMDCPMSCEKGVAKPGTALEAACIAYRKHVVKSEKAEKRKREEEKRRRDELKISAARKLTAEERAVLGLDWPVAS